MIPKTEITNGPGAVVDGKETELKLDEPRVCIQPKTLELLQEQIKHELFAERLYLSIATWCDSEGLTETAEFYDEHAKEERKHAMRFIAALRTLAGCTLWLLRPSLLRTFGLHQGLNDDFMDKGLSVGHKAAVAGG